MPGIPFGANLIHNPNEPDQEAAVVDLYLRRDIRLVSASAFLRLTLPLVYFRVKGIHLSPDGTIVCPNKIIAKVSRVELARRFFAPPPEKLLDKLVAQQKITRQEAELARRLPLADDLTAEADSGGHTDNRPALSLLPTMLALRDEMMTRYRYQRPLCVGLGGGIATPASCAAAFAMGAAYVLTGTINQACVEAGISPTVRSMLAEARQADVTMAPAADMFEMGVKVQVLKRGTLFPQRATKLFDLYTRYDSFAAISAKDRQILTDKFFRCSFDQAWHQTRDFFLDRDPRQVQRAEQDPRHKMALVFRSYLGRSSGWAKTGDPGRKIDYQIWCGPAIGAFNQWCADSFLAHPENRKVLTVALNLLLGAAVITRSNWLRMQFDGVPPGIGAFSPLPLEKIDALIG
jgi:PfaD family protein